MKQTTTLSFFFFLSWLFASGQGDTLTGEFIHNDSLRSYLLYVPEAYDGSEDWPLVLNFHGFSNSASDQMFISQMNPVADTANFLVVYPQGLLVDNPFLGFSAPGWNVDGNLSDNDDLGFTSVLIDRLSAAYAIDLSRVYATGWSMGASIAFQTSCSLAGRIAAVAGVANQMADSQIANCNPGRPVSAMLIQGTADPITPFDGDGVLFSAAANTPSFWANLNNCSPDSLVTDLEDIVTTDTSTVTVTEYKDCDADTEVFFYRVNGGGHSWPGGGELPPFLGKVNRDFNASSVIWNFFNRHPHPNPAGLVMAKSFVHEDSLRSYLLYVPAAYDGSQNWPLVINMHGYALNAGFQMNFSNMNAVADTGHFIVAYPQGTTIVSTVPGIPPQGLGWNVSLASDTTFVSPGNVDDVDFIGQLIDSIRTEYQVAPGRIYATGFSNGAMMANLLGLKLSDRIAAIAPVGGTIPRSQLVAHTGQISMPVFHIHGTADPVVLYGDGDPLLASVAEVMAFWVDQNGCDLEPVISPLPDLTTADSSTLEWQQWSNCAREVIHLRVQDGGHQWPGGNNLLSFLGNFNLDISASSEIWNFFNRNPHPDLSTGTASGQLAESLQFSVYPNPFTEQFTMEFELPQELMVRISLLNVMGQPVAKLGQSVLGKGKHKIFRQIDVGNLTRGLYFIRLETAMGQSAYPILYNP